MAFKQPTIDAEFEEVESCGFCKHIKFTGISNIIDCDYKPEKFTTNSKCDKFDWKIPVQDMMT